MNKELEALNEIVKYAGTYSAHINDQYTILRQALTPPTKEEVCRALSECLEENVLYDNEFGFMFYIGQMPCYINEMTLTKILKEAPHLITLIGRFYEGEIK